MKSGDPREASRPDDESDAEQATDLLPGYTLGVLDDPQRRVVEDELATSQSLRDDHRRYQSAVDLLAAATPLTEPPSALRARVLSLAGTQPAPVEIAGRRNRLARIALAAAAAIVLMLAGAAGILWSELNESNEEIADLRQASSRPSMDLSQPLVWTELSSAEPGMPGTGYFCRTADGAVGWIVVEGMPVTTGDIYQLWLVDGDRHESAGMFVTDDEGRGFGVVRVNAPVTTFDQLWITTEPPGGSNAPTSDPYVSVNIV